VYSRLQRRFGRKVARRRLVRYCLLGVNIILLGGVVWFVVRNPQASVAVTNPTASATQDNAIATNPLDQLSSADVAVNVSRLANLPETTAITNQAQTERAEQAIVQSSATLVAKPQVVATAFKSNKDIKTYIATAGDSVSSIAAKFNVTSDSILWSNDLSGNTVSPGQKLYIPPVNGIVYIVKPGDTPVSLAQAYRSNIQQLIAYNDAEISGLKPGERIIIPNGQEQTTTSTYYSNSYESGFPWGTGPIYNGNGYDYGFCTWYVATQISVPSNWGNASSWAYYASLSGWNVSSHPNVGAVAQTPYAAGGEGHVAVVDAVNATGTMIKYRDMNGIAGWGAVGYSGWVPASTFPNYIAP
jgi:surface antigen